MKPKVYLMNHKSRDCSPIVKYLNKMGIEVCVHTDMSDFYKAKSTKLRMVGIQQNFLGILRDFLSTDERVCVVCQDDICPTNQFGSVIAELQEKMPDDIVMSGMVVEIQQAWGKKWKEAGEPLIYPVKILIGTTMIIPRGVASRVVAMADQEIAEHKYALNPKGEAWGDDQLLATYCLALGIEMYAIMPCLVEHIGYNSVWGGHWNYKGLERKAYKFVRDYDYSSIDWEKEIKMAREKYAKKS